MNFDGNILCSGNPLAYHDVVNQDFNDLPCQVFQIGVLFDQFTTIITNSNPLFDFCKLLLAVDHHTL